MNRPQCLYQPIENTYNKNGAFCKGTFIQTFIVYLNSAYFFLELNPVSV